MLDLCSSELYLGLDNYPEWICYVRYKEWAATHRHSKDREIPFPIYLDMPVYAKTWKETLVEMLYEHALAISYDRYLHS